MKINKKLVNSLHRLTKKSDGKKSIMKLENYKIKLYNLRGQVIGKIGQRESIDYQKLLSKKRR